jgi:hypothetical protein
MMLAALDKHSKGTWIKCEAQKKLLLHDARKKLVQVACSHLMDLIEQDVFLNLTASNLDVVLRSCLPYLIPGLSLPLDKRSNSSYACNDTEVWGQCRAELCVANVSLLVFYNMLTTIK